MVCDGGKGCATHLGMEVQDRDFTFFHEIHNCFYGDAIEVSLVLPMLQEVSVPYLTLHLLPGHKVVVLTIHLTLSDGSAGVCRRKGEGGKEGRRESGRERGREGGEEEGREEGREGGREGRRERGGREGGRKG